MNAPRTLSLARMMMGIALLPLAAVAHVEHGDIQGGFVAGLAHPVLGIDHVIAMIAVGMWGAQLRAPAIWLLPVAFPVVMAFGGVLGAAGVHIPGIEIGIAASAIALGAMVAFVVRPPLWVALLVVATFAIFHGHAHGAELPESASVIAYSAGFVIATGLLHAVGILIGVANRWPVGERLLRAGGAAISVAGVYFLAAHLASG